MEKKSKTKTLFNSWNRPTVGIHQGLCFRHERHREIDRLWYVEVSLVEKLSGKFLEERNKCGHFVCLFCFCFGGRFLMASFIPFFVGKGGRQGVKVVEKCWKGESNWM